MRARDRSLVAPVKWQNMWVLEPWISLIAFLESLLRNRTMAPARRFELMPMADEPQSGLAHKAMPSPQLP